jgi:phage shock protein A
LKNAEGLNKELATVSSKYEQMKEKHRTEMKEHASTKVRNSLPSSSFVHAITFLNVQSEQSSNS